MDSTKEPNAAPVDAVVRQSSPDRGACFDMIGKLQAAQNMASRMESHFDRRNIFRLRAESETIIELVEEAKSLIKALAPSHYE